jgi:hypothetical protein
VAARAVEVVSGPPNNELKLTRSAKASHPRPSQLNSVFGGRAAGE